VTEKFRRRFALDYRRAVDLRRQLAGAPSHAAPGVCDFTSELRPLSAALIAGRGHYEVVMQRLADARVSVWIATANLKEVLVEGPRRSARSRDRFRSVLETFDELAVRGVELRLLHAGAPSRAFRETFDALPRLIAGGMALRQCPRVHFKTVIVDGRFAYFGSANWTGAGLGAKGDGRRNFELGLVSEDEIMIDQIQAMYEAVWSGSQCRACKLSDDGCEAPLDR
jgi:phosphatidylserine/phosphatidylglycerophosphate/cardiolipin synthase-like enzyme